MKKIIIFVFIIIILIFGSLNIYFEYKKKLSVDRLLSYYVYVEGSRGTSITSGSGFLYKKNEGKDYIVTNYHVIADSDLVYVYNVEKNKIQAHILNYDRYSDIAILIVDDKLNLVEADIGDSDKVKIGDSISIVGSPMSIDHIGTVTSGRISSLNKKISISTEFGNIYYDAIQLDANIYFGSSGSPVLNDAGKVIGMVSVKDESMNNVGFAIPSNCLFEQIEKLENNIPLRPTLGAVLTNATNTLLLEEKNINIDQSTGVVLISVENNYPFYDAGLRAGDVIVKIENKDISNVSELQDILYNSNIGDDIEVGYYRNNIYFSTKIILNK